MRLKLLLAYLGTGYSGWQIQEKPSPPPTIQGELEAACACWPARRCGCTVQAAPTRACTPTAR